MYVKEKRKENAVLRCDNEEVINERNIPPVKLQPNKREMGNEEGKREVK
jgi:hypothetical protein